MRKSTILSLSG